MTDISTLSGNYLYKTLETEGQWKRCKMNLICEYADECCLQVYKLITSTCRDNLDLI